MPKKIFVTRQLPKAGIEELKKNKGFLVRVSSYDGVLPRPQLLKEIRGCDAVLTLLTDKVNDEFFKAAGPQLKVVANYAVGFDNIDVVAAKKYGVVITNTPDVVTNAVAEHTVALILATAKRVVEADKFTRAEKYKGWAPMLFLGAELKGKTVGVVGLGRIGFEVAHKLYNGFGMNVVYTDIKRNPIFEKQFKATFCTLPELLKKSDVVTLHVPLLPSTRHLVSTKEFKLMKKTAYLVNTARGPIVDEKALVRALQNGHLAGAALDVFEAEPAIDCDHSDTLELKKLSNVVLTPHIASATTEARTAMAVLAAQNIVAVLNGKKPLTEVG